MNIKNLKLTQMDYALIAGYIFCCVTVLYLSWSLNVPLEHVR